LLCKIRRKNTKKQRRRKERYPKNSFQKNDESKRRKRDPVRGNLSREKKKKDLR